MPTVELALQVGVRAVADRLGDGLHARRALGRRDHMLAEDPGVDQGPEGDSDREVHPEPLEVGERAGVEERGEWAPARLRRGPGRGLAEGGDGPDGDGHVEPPPRPAGGLGLSLRHEGKILRVRREQNGRPYARSAHGGLHTRYTQSRANGGPRLGRRPPDLDPDEAAPFGL